MADWPPVTDWTIGFIGGGTSVPAPFTDGTYFQDGDGTLWGWSGEAVSTGAGPTTNWVLGTGPTSAWGIEQAAFIAVFLGWLMANGVWNDSGIWDDAETWNDGN